jgi:hypothetical protein
MTAFLKVQKSKITSCAGFKQKRSVMIKIARDPCYTTIKL